MAPKLGFERDALDLDKAQAVPGKDSPGNAALPPLGRHRHTDQVLVVALAGALRFGNANAALCAKQLNIDRIDRGQLRRQQPRQGRRGQRLLIHLCEIAFVLDRDGADTGLGQLPGKAPELFRERDVGPQPRRLLGCQGGHVDRVGDGTGQQEIRHLLGDLQRDILLRPRRRRAEMRRCDKVRMTEERIVARGLLDKDIERRARDLAAVERRGEVGLGDEPAPRAVDDPHATLHAGDRGGVDQIARRVVERRVQGDEIGARQQLVQLDLLDTDNAGPFRR